MPNKHFFKKFISLNSKNRVNLALFFQFMNCIRFLLLPKNVFFTIKSNKLQVLNKMLYICMIYKAYFTLNV